jgi:alanyl-tRNA synthetase
VPSSPLVPATDPTLLFTNAGMNQFKDLFLGRERRDYARAATSQKCMRVSGKHNDLDNVGPSLRHHTFFEMLGNFSFGDYFKERGDPACLAAADRGLGDPGRSPARDGLRRRAGSRATTRRTRIWRVSCRPTRSRAGAADNFWQMGDTGPCGRCSEIHYFRGTTSPAREPVCGGSRLRVRPLRRDLEQRLHGVRPPADGTLNPLPAPSIDTGMGLERVTPCCRASRLQLRHRPLHADAAAIGERTGVRYERHAGRRRTCRCGSSPTTFAP